MALRHASWVVAVLTLAVLVFLIRPPEGRTTVPAATDVLFVFDTTGSMSGALSEAQAQAAQVMSGLSGRLPNLRFGVAQVRDYGSTPVWRVEQTITSSQGAVQAAIDGLSANEGGDAPEAYGTALHQSRTDVAAGWAPGAKHVVVLIADDVPHDGDLNEGVPPEIVNQPSPWNTGVDPGLDGAGIDWQQELASFKGADFTLAFVLYHGVPAYLPYWNWWAGLTGGQATESSSSTPLGDVLIEIITASASTCQSDGEDDPPQCDADEAPAFSADAPVLPAAPAPVDSSDPDAPNDGIVSGTCSPPMPPGPEQGEQTGTEAGAASAPATSPWFCPAAGEIRPSVPAVTWSQNTTAISFRNADGVWTIYKRCIDRVASGQRTTVGPGYIAELARGGTSIVQDFRARGDTVTPGYINAVNGGLGTFGWHHARGTVEQHACRRRSDDERRRGRSRTLAAGDRGPHVCGDERRVRRVRAELDGPDARIADASRLHDRRVVPRQVREHGCARELRRPRTCAVSLHLLPLVREPVGARDDVRGAQCGGNAVRQGAQVHGAD